MIPLPLVIPETPKLAKTDFAKVFRNPATGQHSLHATVFFDEGEIICSFSAKETFPTPSYLTLQTGLNQHISLAPECLQFTNHSCEPNIFFDTEKMELVALRSIQPDDEMVFFYPSTEWQMASPFTCNCGSAQCLGTIAGAASLKERQLQNYRLTRFIQLQIQNQ